jgi:hypothetical protein
MYPAMSARVDVVALHAPEYAAGRTPRLVATAPARYLSVDGEGAVAGTPFVERALALEGLLRALRARIRREDGKDFRIPPLEALLGAPRSPTPRDEPDGQVPWKLLLRIPAFVRPSDLAGLAEDGDGEWDGPTAARIEELREGRCIQVLHVGPLDGLPAAVERVRRAAVDQDLVARGRVHVVWMTDPARTPPERRRTLVRLPVKPR